MVFRNLIELKGISFNNINDPNKEEKHEHENRHPYSYKENKTRRF
jgi:hypothetical protein